MSNRFRIRRIAVLLAVLCLAAFCVPTTIASASEEAHELTLTLEGKGSMKKLTDGSYKTSVAFGEGASLTVTASEPMHALYLVWSEPPEPWTLTVNGEAQECGRYGFLHELVPLEGGAESVTVSMPAGGSLCIVRAYSAGTLPKTVQAWEPPCEKADILAFSTHADDEILFLGGVLAEYAGERKLAVQVVYFSNYFLTGGSSVIREHEKLDGLWAIGVRQYPVNGNFRDEYAKTLKDAKKLFDYDEGLEFLTEQLRRFKPQVCVAQDTNGEYGHGTHMLTSALMQEAVTLSMDPARFTASAERYGVWDVPKTYIHLHKENPIRLDCRVPLTAFGGMTAVDVAAAAYKQHVSQQWCWFYVSDEYEYSIAEFGLYRTTVGTDTGGDMMEHLTSYAEQERLAREEAERLEAERLEAERLAREEAERLEAERLEAERLAREKAERLEAEETARRERTARVRRTALIVAIAAGVGLVADILWLTLPKKRKRKRGRHEK